ncbi:GntR family transcriptional regulator [Gryllotalpicola reticulitermitis]|uniref:GntR family transcriptional regulator n=1 Tax=Gryllotalpicola reticulitermitis TaxID=1184153 RepID=A0ABV8Q447_9MICO
MAEMNLMVAQVEESIPARVVRVVRQAILDGVLAPGRRLTERELCELTGVSRTSIREAILHLQNLGLVEPSDSRGIRVVVLGRDDVQHIYELREALEALAAELFVRHATDDEAEELQRYVPPADAASEQRMELIFKFDELLIAGSHNPLLRDALETLHTRVHALRRLSTSVEGRQEASSREFLEIAEAIRARDPERASSAVHQHVRAAAEAALIAVDRLDDSAAGAEEKRRLQVRPVTSA